MGAEKQKLALDWIYRWGWSSPTILDIVTSGARSGISLRLLRNKLLIDTATASGGVQDTPKKLLTLSQSGLEEVTRECLYLINYEIDAYRIDQSKLRHDGLTQLATARALKSGAITSFKTPHELAARSAKNIKQPDVLWIKSDGTRIGVELELSPKWERKLDQFVQSCIDSLNNDNENRVNAVHEIYLITDSKAIVERYSKAFTPGKKYSYWEKNSGNYWVTDSMFVVPSWMEGKVICDLI